MQNDETNIPDPIFGWIENKDFDALSASEKAEVLSFFTEEEYNELHEVANVLAKPASGSRKTALFERFDRQHGKPKIVSLQKNRFDLFRAAAILVPLLSLAVFLAIKDSGSENLVSLSSVRDTVYVEKEGRTDTVVQHDTVYRDVVRRHPQRQSSTEERPAVVSSGVIETFDVLSLDQLDGAMNVTKGNSLKDDSLWLMFEAARL